MTYTTAALLQEADRIKAELDSLTAQLERKAISPRVFDEKVSDHARDAKDTLFALVERLKDQPPVEVAVAEDINDPDTSVAVFIDGERVPHTAFFTDPGQCLDTLLDQAQPTATSACFAWLKRQWDGWQE